jgi:phage baseplate assembly protein W
MNYNIFTQPNKITGLKLPFKGNIGLNPVYDNNESIKFNLINFILTNRRERFMRPNFGLNLRELLFDNNTNIDDIKENIIYSIQNNFKEINIIKLDLIQNNHELNLILKYNINNIEDNISIIINNNE